MTHQTEVQNLVGHYLVHQKHNPNFKEDILNYCYRITEIILDAETDTIKILYKRLYTKVPDREVDQLIIAYSRSYINILSEKNGQPRFRIFATQRDMHVYLAQLAKENHEKAE